VEVNESETKTRHRRHQTSPRVFPLGESLRLYASFARSLPGPIMTKHDVIHKTGST